MRLVILNHKLEGNKLALPIYNANGMLFLNKGVILSRKHINNIEKLGIRTVYIADGYEDVQLQEIIDSPIKLEITKLLKVEFENIKKKKEINEDKMVDIANRIISNINLSENAFLHNNIAKKDDFEELVDYSLNTAILAIKIGVTRKYDKKKLVNLALGALFHHIGMLFTKTEEHVNIGYKLIKANNYFSPTTAVCVYQHHENVDGSGYPNKLTGESIYEFAQIVRICGNYIKSQNGDTLTSLPHQVLEKITALVSTKFDAEIFKEFTKSIYCYPTGLTVKLNNGLEAIVICQNENFPLRPIISVDINGKRGFINLIDHLTLFVEKVIV